MLGATIDGYAIEAELNSKFVPRRLRSKIILSAECQGTVVGPMSLRENQFSIVLSGEIESIDDFVL
jgi:hypothetical protein